MLAALYMPKYFKGVKNRMYIYHRRSQKKPPKADACINALIQIDLASNTQQAKKDIEDRYTVVCDLEIPALEAEVPLFDHTSKVSMKYGGVFQHIRAKLAPL